MLLHRRILCALNAPNILRGLKSICKPRNTLLEDRLLVRGWTTIPRQLLRLWLMVLVPRVPLEEEGAMMRWLKPAGPATPGIGFGLGMERIILCLKNQGLVPQVKETTGVLLQPYPETTI